MELATVIRPVRLILCPCNDAIFLVMFDRMLVSIWSFANPNLSTHIPRCLTGLFELDLIPNGSLRDRVFQVLLVGGRSKVGSA